MTYSINVQPYDDPFIKLVEEAMVSGGELFIAGAFLVDIIPILKYVPEWFPGSGLQGKATNTRRHAASIRNFTLAATEKLMVCYPVL